VDKITVVCHKDHDKGYEDYVGKCLLCEVERLRKREWVGLTHPQIHELDWPDGVSFEDILLFVRAIEQALKEKNT